MVGDVPAVGIVPVNDIVRQLFLSGVGVDLGSASEMPVGAMISQVIGLFLMSWFVGVTAASNALLTVLLATAAFGVLAYSSGMFAQKSGYARGVEAGYLAISLVVMIVAQGIF